MQDSDGLEGEGRDRIRYQVFKHPLIPKACTYHYPLISGPILSCVLDRKVQSEAYQK